MLHNVCSTTERIVRVIVGLAILSLMLFLEGTARYWGLLGLIPIATAIFRYCPISYLLHVDTCKTRHA
ncbi:MAG: DUF2892 domain-containing protein [Desulfuromonadales bacterium]|nr:DUF2892 domain-containing protein [Desulfuromonadales bacterium]